MAEINGVSLRYTCQINGGGLRLQKSFTNVSASKTSLSKASQTKEAAAHMGERKPRADAQRNRERILEVAQQVFTTRGAAASMDEIAKKAKIGPGTLYRHFATRDDLLSAVYIHEVEKLAEAQRRLAAELPPMEALRAWLLLFVDYIAAKKIILPALNAMTGGPSGVFERSGRFLKDAADSLVSEAIRNNDIRPDVEAFDVLRAIYGVSSGESGIWPERARLMVDILLRGARPSI
jgi:AcrR family transcriptional regulator